MADPWAGWTDSGPRAPAPQADPWAGWRDLGPNSDNAGRSPGAQTYAERSAGAFDPSAYRPTSLGDPTQMREVPEPDWSHQSIGEMMRNVSQRGRNTAWGEGPGSVAGIPGAAAIPAAVGWPFAAEGARLVFGPAAGGLARGAAAAAKQLPGTALAATAGYVASHFDDQPDWVKEFVHNLLLHFQLGAGGKK
jgi:hypothetical protein